MSGAKGLDKFLRKSVFLGDLVVSARAGIRKYWAFAKLLCEG
jgi:hypothetical protein